MLRKRKSSNMVDIFGNPSCEEIVRFDEKIRGGSDLLLAGVDEAGRGALAGPVVAACVICGYHSDLRDVRDSKLIDEGKRERIFEIILRKSSGINVGVVYPEEIDRINILEATLKAMKSAVEGLTLRPEMVLIDGRDLPDIGHPAMPVIGGDGRSFVIAAASIVAKVFRDRIMRRFHSEFPGYNFFRNKGYGTAEHRLSISRIGLTRIHRRSFRYQL